MNDEHKKEIYIRRRTPLQYENIRFFSPKCNGAFAGIILGFFSSDYPIYSCAYE